MAILGAVNYSSICYSLFLQILLLQLHLLQIQNVLYNVAQYPGLELIRDNFPIQQKAGLFLSKIKKVTLQNNLPIFLLNGEFIWQAIDSSLTKELHDLSIVQSFSRYERVRELATCQVRTHYSGSVFTSDKFASIKVKFSSRVVFFWSKFAWVQTH